MSDSEFSRWCCLVEAFEFIATKADDLKLDYSDFMKPIYIDKYISEMYPSMLLGVEFEREAGLI